MGRLQVRANQDSAVASTALPGESLANPWRAVGSTPSGWCRNRLQTTRPPHHEQCTGCASLVAVGGSWQPLPLSRTDPDVCMPRCTCRGASTLCATGCEATRLRIAGGAPERAR
jgi:hypothetical protein